MRALILAAGRGERMRPLTDTLPKPLLVAGGRRLIEWQIDALVRAGVSDIVINVAHLARCFEPALGDGREFGATIAYSREGERAEDALETLGGIVKALPLLGADPFVVVSGDIVTDFDYATLHARAAAIAAGAADAHLVLVDNPPFHARGDMGLVDGRIAPDVAPRFTYANIGVFAPGLFAGLAPRRTRMFPWLYGAAQAGRVTGEHYEGRWHNVGTPGELARLDAALRSTPQSAP
jgi:MurNAc alpha-1-phosphate uridylyltransferase